VKERLGDSFDISIGFAPVDMQTTANTGKRIRLRHCDALTVVFFKGAGTAGDDPVITLQEHTAYTGGTSANLAVIDRYHVKSETTLDGDETWTTVTQTAAATITDPGGAGTSAEEQQIVVFSVSGDSLTDGYEWVNASVADVGGNAQLGCLLYLPHDLATKRAPSKMPEWLQG
jgi:hypothetical protein